MRPAMTRTLRLAIALLVSTFAGVGAAAADPTGTLQGTIDGLGKGPFIVYVDQIPGAKYPAQEPAPLMGQKNNTYIPHVLPVVVGSKVELRSSDPELHNVYAWAQALGRVAFNIAIPPNFPPTFQQMNQVGVIKLTCNVHKDMLAYIVVLQNPFFSLTAKSQTEFTIDKIPVGTREVRIWGEKLEPVDLARKYLVEIKPGQVTKVTIGPAKTAAR
jgi:plastocyanin